MNETEVTEFPGTRSRNWQLGVLLGAGRVAFGGLFLLAPARTARLWTRTGTVSSEGVTYLRTTGGRDLALGLGTLITAWRNSPDKTGWILAGMLADSIDLYAFTVDDSMRVGPRVVAGLIAGGAVVGGLLALTE